MYICGTKAKTALSQTSCLLSGNPPHSFLEILHWKTDQRQPILQAGGNKERGKWKTHISCRFKKGHTVDTSPPVRGPASVSLSLPPHHLSTTQHTQRQKQNKDKNFPMHIWSQIAGDWRAMELIMWCMILRRMISGTLFEPLYLVQYTWFLCLSVTASRMVFQYMISVIPCVSIDSWCSIKIHACKEVKGQTRGTVKLVTMWD